MTHAREKNILVVDDEPDVREYLAAIIEDAGFEVEMAKDGVEAFEKMVDQLPDLITLDMVMPRKSGIQFMRELRDNEKYTDIPVIVITAHSRDEFGAKDIKDLTAFATRKQPKKIIDKPVTPSKLVHSIADILDVEIEEVDG